MSDYSSNSNRGKGALFRIPEDQRKSEKYPTYRGDISFPDGSKWKLSGWVRETKTGDKFLSLSAEPFEEQRPQPAASNTYASATSRDDRRQGGCRVPSRDDPVPFMPEVR